MKRTFWGSFLAAMIAAYFIVTAPVAGAVSAETLPPCRVRHIVENAAVAPVVRRGDGLREMISERGVFRREWVEFRQGSN